MSHSAPAAVCILCTKLPRTAVFFAIIFSVHRIIDYYFVTISAVGDLRRDYGCGHDSRHSHTHTHTLVITTIIIIVTIIITIKIMINYYIVIVIIIILCPRRLDRCTSRKRIVRTLLPVSWTRTSLYNIIIIFAPTNSSSCSKAMRTPRNWWNFNVFKFRDFIYSATVVVSANTAVFFVLNRDRSIACCSIQEPFGNRCVNNNNGYRKTKIIDSYFCGVKSTRKYETKKWVDLPITARNTRQNRGEYF